MTLKRKTTMDMKVVMGKLEFNVEEIIRRVLYDIFFSGQKIINILIFNLV